jgi:hypothetical protein
MSGWPHALHQADNGASHVASSDGSRVGQIQGRRSWSRLLATDGGALASYGGDGDALAGCGAGGASPARNDKSRTW